MNLGIIWSKLLIGDKKLICISLKIFSGEPKYKEIGDNMEFNKLVFIPVKHTIDCLNAGHNLLAKDGDVHGENIIVKMENGDNIDVSNIWDYYRHRQQRIWDLVSELS